VCLAILGSPLIRCTWVMMQTRGKARVSCPGMVRLPLSLFAFTEEMIHQLLNS